MGGSASYTGGGGPPMPSTNNTLSQRMGLPGMEGHIDPRVAELIQRYGLRGPGGIGPGSGTPGTGTRPPAKPPTTPTTPAAPPRQFSWQFPQYSQTWAFTPPTPSSFTLPPLFDPKSSTQSSATTGPADRGPGWTQLLRRT